MPKRPNSVRSRPRASRSQPPRRSRAALWLLVLLLIALGLFTAYRRHPEWLHGLEVRLHLAPPTALQQSQSAAFTTIEQLDAQGVAAASRVFRVQARLVRFDLEPNGDLRLVLASLVHPATTLEARVLPPGAASSQEDAALYAELRQDIGLQFGQPSAHPTALASPPQVIVTGRAALAAGRVEIRPVFDFRVQ